jgi:hypothetical protein
MQQQQYEEEIQRMMAEVLKYILSIEIECF